jgi:branched-chain amino acid transport system ATP-binding protein
MGETVATGGTGVKGRTSSNVDANVSGKTGSSASAGPSSNAAAGHGDAAAIRLQAVRKSFGKTEIIRGVDLEVPTGERHALIGPNGAGKSTLFNLISARLAVSSGTIELKGQPINGLPPYRINRMGLSRSFQITNIFPRLSVFENIRCATLYGMGYRYSFWHRLSRLRDTADRAEDVMTQIGLRYRRDVLAANLTYAEQRALEIGITVASGADVILLDEPTAGMSRSESQQAVALIRRMTEGKTLVMVEHDMGVVFDLADRISVLVYGEIIATEKPAAIRSNAAVQEAYLGKPVVQEAVKAARA